jgi:hypothetical protein
MGEESHLEWFWPCPGPYEQYLLSSLSPSQNRCRRALSRGLLAFLSRFAFDGDVLRLWYDVVASFEGDSPKIVRDRRISMRGVFSEGTNVLATRTRSEDGQPLVPVCTGVM